MSEKMMGQTQPEEGDRNIEGGNVEGTGVERRKERIKPVEVIFVDVDGAQGPSDVLAHYPGFVLYDESRHDIKGLHVKKGSITRNLPSFGHMIVKEQ